jgi:SAM-dependent methyltransferase
MLLIRGKVLVCPSESLLAAYQIAVDESFSAPDSQASVKGMMAVYDIVDLTVMSCDGQSAASAMIARYCSGVAEYPELTFEQFTDVVERLFMKGLLTVSIGAINFGDFKRLIPMCFEFGSTRGTPIDRYYLSRFIEKIHPDVVGDALEIGGNRRNRRLYNFMQTNSYRAMDLNKRLGVDIIGDAHNAKIVEHGSLDSIIIFNVLEHCEKPWIVIENMYDWLRDGGKVFCMVPTAQRIHGAPSDFWRFLPNAIDSLFAKFPIRKLFIYGNPMTAIASLMGVAAEELSREELDHTNSEYPVATCILAQKHAGHSMSKL